MTDANAFLDQALTDHAAGRLDPARRDYRRALALAPALATALHYLGTLECQTGAAPAAGVALMRRGLRLTPQNGLALAQLAGALAQTGAAPAGETAARRALVLAPQLADACEAAGLLRYYASDYRGAVGWLLRAHYVNPRKTETLIGLGAALRDGRQFAAAATVYDAAIQRRPDLPEAWLGRAVTRLTQGDLPGGWADLDHRWQYLPDPPWAGEDVAGRTLLLHAEQGFGDTIQFARYARLAADRGAKVILTVHPALTRLLARLDPRVTVTAGPPHAPLPAYDRHCPLLSLPRAFNTTLDSIPAAPAYLSADPAERALALRRLGGGGPGAPLHVGLCWAGNPAHKNDHNRSLPPALLTDLLLIEGARFWSLQTGPARQAMPAPLRAALPELLSPDGDFADTAAVVSALDLVITVDTALAHLAGALGVACWVLLPYAPDWRWLLDRVDSPWYPSLRLIRQPRPNDWPAAAAQAAALLRGVTAQRRARREPAQAANPAP